MYLPDLPCFSAAVATSMDFVGRFCDGCNPNWLSCHIWQTSVRRCIICDWGNGVLWILGFIKIERHKYLSGTKTRSIRDDSRKDLTLSNFSPTGTTHLPNTCPSTTSTTGHNPQHLSSNTIEPGRRNATRGVSNRPPIAAITAPVVNTSLLVCAELTSRALTDAGVCFRYDQLPCEVVISGVVTGWHRRNP